MARMKIEVLAARRAQRGLSLHDWLVGYLPRYAPYAARMAWLLNLRNTIPGAAKLSELIAGFSARRSLPEWRPDWFRDNSLPRTRGVGEGVSPQVMTRGKAPSRPGFAGSTSPASGRGEKGRDVVLFADTFNRYFEPENIAAAIEVLTAAGCRVHVPTAQDGTRPLCCGRTFLAVGRVDEARREAERTVAALAPYVDEGMAFIGLEPSCLFSFRDEIPSLLKTGEARRLADQALLFEEYIARQAAEGAPKLALAPLGRRALLHGHCHQKAFGTMGAVEAALRLVPGLAVETIESSCCGMAGAFGYGTDTIDVSLRMGEHSLLPAVRAAPPDALIVADGTSCRHQIKDTTPREALHVARVLAMSVAAARSSQASLT
jgi:Fe-S oxidoreductase